MEKVINETLLRTPRDEWYHRLAEPTSYSICHLTDAFIQSDLQSCVHTLYVCVALGIKPTTLGVASAMLDRLSHMGPLAATGVTEGVRQLHCSLCAFKQRGLS